MFVEVASVDEDGSYIGYGGGTPDESEMDDADSALTGTALAGTALASTALAGTPLCQMPWLAPPLCRAWQARTHLADFPVQPKLESTCV